MEFRSERYRVVSKNKKTRSMWVGLIDEGDIIQFKIYSTGSGGSGTTYHLLVNEGIQMPKGKRGEFDRLGKNAFGSNIVDAIMNNLEVENLGF